MSTAATTLGANIRAELARKGLTQTSLAEHLELSKSAVTNRLSGRTPIDVNELVRIADFLAVNIDVLLRDPDADPARRVLEEHGVIPARDGAA